MKIIAAFILFLSLVSNVYAHGGEMHMGKGLEGMAVKISETGCTVKGEAGETKVSFTDETKFVIGEEGKDTKKSDLKENSHVLVHGTKLESGEVVAKEVVIHLDSK